MGEPPPQPNGSPRENENDQDGCQDPKAVTRHATTMLAVRTRIQERVGVEPLSVVGQVRERDIQQENQHQDRKRQKRMRVRGGEDDFQQGPEGVEAVLRDLQSFIALATLDTHFATLFFFFFLSLQTWTAYIRPSLKSPRIPRRLKQNRPEYDRHEKREGGDGGVENGMQGAQRTRQSVEEHGAPCACVTCGMDRRDEIIEAQTPVREPGEVAEALANRVGVAVGAVPAPDEKDGDEDVEGDEGAEESEGERREEPGGFVAVAGVEGGVDAEGGFG